MKRVIIAFLVLLIATSIGCGSQPIIPGDSVISPPDPALPLELKAMSGKWSGTWVTDDETGQIYGRDAIMIIERVGLESIQVLYAWGGSRGSSTKAEAGDTRKRVRFTQDGEKVIFILGNKVFTFFPSKNIIEGVERNPGVTWNATVTMKRIQ